MKVLVSTTETWYTAAMNKSTLRRIWLRLEIALFGYSYSPLVKLLEFLVVSGCPYCSAVRAMLFGYGVGRWDWTGLALVIVAVLLNHLEKRINDE